MKKNLLLAGFIGFAVAVTFGYFWYFSDPGLRVIEPSDPAVVERGKAVYGSHCAACHGTSLEGQPEWRKRLPNGRLPAPPHDHTGHTWHHPDRVLVDIVKNGLVPGRTAPEGYQSDMPAYAGILTDADVEAVLAYIKSSWPADVLEMQRKLNAQQGRP